jgi:hypothetical protein
MSIRFDEKGKFFTDFVSKEVVEVVIQTPTNLIKGRIHVHPDERLSDEINHAELFIAVTEASILNLSGAELYRCGFMALNREHIIWLLPENEIKHQITSPNKGAS